MFLCHSLSDVLSAMLNVVTEESGVVTWESVGDDMLKFSSED